MLFIFALPVMQVILFCLAIGRDPTGLKLAIVNHEMDFSTKDCPVYNNCSFSHLSCRYLKFLDNETMIKVSGRCLNQAKRWFVALVIILNFVLLAGILSWSGFGNGSCEKGPSVGNIVLHWELYWLFSCKNAFGQRGWRRNSWSKRNQGLAWHVKWGNINFLRCYFFL